MNPIEKQEQRRREQLRRRLFSDAYLAGSLGWSDSQEMGVLAQLNMLDVTMQQVRNVLEYLEGLGLIQVERRAYEWHYKITALGCQVYEGNAPWPVGISPRVL
ncbi:hypothetical protein GS597_01390 [Synechococcales cyanobacterium C]|uniref:Uncharacterized protein n=1 Tax=Petrachloros mirabilis ULC683 TaxID=2781853 RepID=A0A8K2ABU5_9CYAN|nr:hypothetical protein [Petrachloros mirabilis]NCJ05193.1 hypothetical protein [Petrachloros mirabilis ULC683]